MEQVSNTNPNPNPDSDDLILDPTSIPDFVDDDHELSEDDGRGWGELPGYYEDDVGGWKESEPYEDDGRGWGELPGYYEDNGGGWKEPEPCEDDGRGWGELPGYYEDNGGGWEEPLHEPYGYDGKGWEEPEPNGYDGRESEPYGGLEEPEPYGYDGKGWEEPEPYIYDGRGWEEPLHEPVYGHEHFEQDYLCLPISHIDKHHLEDGNKVIMPASALGRLMDMNIDQYPMLFEIKNHGTGRVSHCGVLEFSAEEGFVHLPNWMMKNMKFREGDLVSLKSIVGLPKGEYMKIQPHEMKFVMNLKNPKDVLEAVLKDFTCVTAGDTIMITHEGQKYFIDVVETKPSNAISLFETDCEVDFATPLDYKEPEKKPTSVIKNEKIAAERVEEEAKFKAFTGVGRRLGGQILPAKDECCNASSNSAARSNSESEENMGKKGDLEDKSSDVEGKKFQAFTGKKYTLAD